MASFCTSCGNRLDAGQRFCISCGAAIPEEHAATAATPQVAISQDAAPPQATMTDPFPATTPSPVTTGAASPKRRRLLVAALSTGAVLIIVVAVLLVSGGGSTASPEAALSAFVGAIQNKDLPGALNYVDPADRPAESTANSAVQQFLGGSLAIIQIKSFAVQGQTVQGDHAWVRVSGQVCTGGSSFGAGYCGPIGGSAIQAIAGGGGLAGGLSAIIGSGPSAGMVPCELVGGQWYVYIGNASWASQGPSAASSASTTSSTTTSTTPEGTMRPATPQPSTSPPLAIAGSTFSPTSGGTSTYSAQYSANISAPTTDGATLVVPIDATGQSDLRDPSSSCVLVDYMASTYTILPITETLTVNQPGNYIGTLSFPLVLPGTYSFEYSCQTDYSTVNLGDFNAPILGVSASSANRSFAAVLAVAPSSSSTVVSFAAVGPPDLPAPNSSCLTAAGQTVQGTTQVTYQSPTTLSEFVMGSISFSGTGDTSFTYACGAGGYSAVQVGS